jgi:hypothetical protein
MNIYYLHFFVIFISLSLFNLIHMLAFTLQSFFVSFYYLFNNTHCGLTGHQMYMVANENCFSLIMHFAFYK